jgi:hypothetical protein
VLDQVQLVDAVAGAVHNPNQDLDIEATAVISRPWSARLVLVDRTAAVSRPWTARTP